MKKMLLMFALVFSCGGETDSTMQPQSAEAAGCECTQDGCGTNSDYAKSACAPFHQACVDARDPAEHQRDCAEGRSSCNDCAVLYSNCVNCFANGFDGDANGTCVNGQDYRDC